MTDYRLKSASADDIQKHLLECQDSFIPPLSSTVNIDEYSRKIFASAFTVEAWEQEKLIGFIAVYLNDPQKNMGFITNVSLLTEFKGKGIASKLLESCVDSARKSGFKFIKLEVAVMNDNAIKLYEKYGFKIVSTENNKHTMQLML